MRELLLLGALGPLIDIYTRARVFGREHLTALQPPVVFVANHSSHMDPPVILRALPAAWRRRTAVAAAADYFYRVPWLAHVVSLAFNTVPVERKGEGSETASGLARLIGEGWSLLLFAEGTRSRDGTVGRLHSGAAVLAAEHRVAIVPIYVSGMHAGMAGCALAYLSVYDRSKHLGEQAAFRAARQLGVELVAVNPSSVQGRVGHPALDGS